MSSTTAYPLLTDSDQAVGDKDKYHVLVVDDSKLQRKILLNWLQDSFQGV
jgi:PleD family two-component response regulator